MHFDENPSRDIWRYGAVCGRIQICGSLTYSLLQTAKIIVITGGFLSGKKLPGAISTDYSILEGARKYSREKDIELSECLETWLPDTDAEIDNSKKEVVRFREGNVKELTGESAQARRFLMVKDVHALITVKGKKHTAMVLDFALTINKPAFPLAFTGGDSLNYWNAHKERIRQWFDIDNNFLRDLEIEEIEVLTFPARDQLIRKITRSVYIGVEKEIANNKKYKIARQKFESDENDIDGEKKSSLQIPKQKTNKKSEKKRPCLSN